MGTQENVPPLEANVRDAVNGELSQGLHQLDFPETAARECGGVQGCEISSDASPAPHNTSWRLPQKQKVRGICEAFFKLTLSDGATVNLLAPSEPTWAGDVAAQEAVKFIEDPAAELEAFLAAYTRSH